MLRVVLQKLNPFIKIMVAVTVTSFTSYGLWFVLFPLQRSGLLHSLLKTDVLFFCKFSNKVIFGHFHLVLLSHLPFLTVLLRSWGCISDRWLLYSVTSSFYMLYCASFFNLFIGISTAPYKYLVVFTVYWQQKFSFIVHSWLQKYLPKNRIIVSFWLCFLIQKVNRNVLYKAKLMGYIINFNPSSSLCLHCPLHSTCYADRCCTTSVNFKKSNDIRHWVKEESLAVFLHHFFVV